MQSQGSTYGAPDVEREVNVDRVAMLYRQALGAIPMSVGVAVLFTIVEWAAVPHRSLIEWFGASCLVFVARFAIIIAYRRSAQTQSPLLWEQRFFYATVVGGMVWGAMSYALSPQGDVYRYLVLLVVMGMTSGAVGSLASSLRCFFALSLPMLLPAMFWMFASPAPVDRAAGGMAFLFTAAMVLVVRSINASVVNALRLQHVNARLARELQTLATRDPLTGLPNRLILSERLDGALRRANRSTHDVAVLFVDCDGFKAVNDAYGHQIGDAYLQHTARTLTASVRDVDTVARLGGDEFIVLLERCGTRETVRIVCERIANAFKTPFVVDDLVLPVRLSVGISMYPGDSTSAESLVHQADEAMYSAKRRGGNCFVMYGEHLTFATRSAQSLPRLDSRRAG